MHDVESHMRQETWREDFLIVEKDTNLSQVCSYGDDSLAEESIASYLTGGEAQGLSTSSDDGGNVSISGGASRAGTGGSSSVPSERSSGSSIGVASIGTVDASASGVSGDLNLTTGSSSAGSSGDIGLSSEDSVGGSGSVVSAREAKMAFLSEAAAARNSFLLEYEQEREHEREVDYIFGGLMQELNLEHIHVPKLCHAKPKPPHLYDATYFRCLEDLISFFQNHCMTLSDYSMKYIKNFSHICASGVPIELARQAIGHSCNVSI